MKPSLDAFKLADMAVVEEIKGEKANETLKEYWIKLGEQLEIDGVPKEKICVTAAELIVTKKSERTKIPKEELKPSGWFYEVYNSQGWTNQFYARHTSETVTEQEQANSSINTPNQGVIDRLRFTRELVNLTINKFEDCEDINTLFDESTIKEWYEQWDAILGIAEDAVNEKTKIPQNTEHLLLYCLATESSLTQGAKIFMKTRVKLMEQVGKFLTVKQATKFKNGDKPNQLPLFDPDSRDVAIFLKYYGLQCPKCKSWKVRQHSDSRELHCIDCDNTFTGRTVSKCWYCQAPLYKEDLIKMIPKENHCPHCDKEVRLPQELINYANA